MLAASFLPCPCLDDITDAMGDVLDRIIKLPARSIEGLAAKTCIIGWSYGDTDDIPEFDGYQWREEGHPVRALVEAVLALAGRSRQAAEIGAA